MRKNLLEAIILSVVALSCSKSGGEEYSGINYYNTANGSTWQYERTDNTTATITGNYTLTSTNRDTVISDKSYHIYKSSTIGADEYKRRSGNSYSAFHPWSDESSMMFDDILYLKTNVPVSSSWSQTFGLPIDWVQLTGVAKSTVIEKDISRTVHAHTYDSVIHIETVITISGFPTGNISGNINAYYAPGYGVIETTATSLNTTVATPVTTNITTRLKSAILY